MRIINLEVRKEICDLWVSEVSVVLWIIFSGRYKFCICYKWNLSCLLRAYPMVWFCPCQSRIWWQLFFANGLLFSIPNYSNAKASFVPNSAKTIQHWQVLFSPSRSWYEGTHKWHLYLTCREKHKLISTILLIICFVHPPLSLYDCLISVHIHMWPFLFFTMEQNGEPPWFGCDWNLYFAFFIEWFLLPTRLGDICTLFMLLCLVSSIWDVYLLSTIWRAWS